MKMTINRHNFEAYLLDYLEGNLDPLLVADLMAFMAENPELENTIAAYNKNIKLSEIVEYIDKSPLKKGFSDISVVTQDNFDEFCIAASENLLEEKDMTRLMEYIQQHPWKQNDYALYQRLKLQSDRSLVYPGKHQLKKPTRFPFQLRYMYYVAGIAASIALLFMIMIRKPNDAVYSDNKPANIHRPDFAVQQPPANSHKRADKQIPGSVTSKNKLPVEITEFHADEKEDFINRKQVDVSLSPQKPIVAFFVENNQEPPRMFEHLAPGSGMLNTSRSVNQVMDEQTEFFSGSYIGKLIGKIDFWKAAESAIEGFNQLTEAHLSLERKMNESGNLTVLLETENYAISGTKIK
jgi:hypothetical protein